MCSGRAKMDKLIFFLRVAVLLLIVHSLTVHADWANESKILQDIRKEYNYRIQQCEAKFDAFAADIEHRLAKQNELIAAKMSADCSCGDKEAQNTKRQIFVLQSVAFSAQLSSDLYNISDYQAIIFDFVETNIGNGYDATSGIFTSPTSGVFVFIWTTTNYNNHAFLQSELMVNGTAKGRQWSDSGLDDDVSSATGSLVLRLNSGDKVWVRTNTAHLSDTLKGGLMSSFSGWML